MRCPFNLYQVVRELLTGYDDNFVSEPCEEIIEEVVEEVEEILESEEGLTEDEIMEIINEVIDNLFE